MEMWPYLVNEDGLLFVDAADEDEVLVLQRVEHGGHVGDRLGREAPPLYHHPE